MVLKKLISLLILLTAAVILSVTAEAGEIPNITAPIAVVMCFDTGEILYERSMDRRWIPASMTKSMTAFITYQEIGLGNLTLDTRIRVSPGAASFSQDRRQEGSFVPLQQNTYITVEMLLRLMMLPSSNGAAVVLAEHISGTEAAFVNRMNETAAELGMYSSFTNSHGAHAHHTNAYSMALLIREFITRYPDILRITSMPFVNFNGTHYNNTNRLLTDHAFNTHPFEGADGFKTGTIRASGWGHSTTAMRDGRRVIAVVMNTANNNARQQDSRVLLQFGFDEIARRDAAASARVRVFYTGMIIPMSQPAVAERDRLFLPAADILRNLGFTVDWNGTYRIFTAENETGHITLFVDRPLAFIRGKPVTLDVPARMINNRVYVPLSFIEAATDTVSSWDRQTGVVRLRPE